MKKKRWNTLLYCLAGVLFFLAAWLGENYMFIPIGCCFVVLGIVNGREDKDK